MPLWDIIGIVVKAFANRHKLLAECRSRYARRTRNTNYMSLRGAPIRAPPNKAIENGKIFTSHEQQNRNNRTEIIARE